MAAGINIDNVDRVDLIKIGVQRETAIGVDNAGIEPDAEQGGDAGIFAGIASFPFMITVPRRRFTHLIGIFVNGGIEIGRARFYAGAHDRHVQKRRAHIDDNLAAGLADQPFGRFNVQRIQRVRLQAARTMLAAFVADRGNNGFAFGHGARCDMNVAK